MTSLESSTALSTERALHRLFNSTELPTLMIVQTSTADTPRPTLTTKSQSHRHEVTHIE
ncbi:hypothetical protein GCM10022223_05850 [Kineosporia mesophila]|uniref:Uncharacterized protein n=1 Tax=Kineosporia mesophila TaxID=566012 RepID=A0ABP6YZ87_9ACTN|nr:hypothetical protein [Kineosporia mesophila]MCD5350969.1 hypothetical protein [Kineosporia mesophila]